MVFVENSLNIKFGLSLEDSLPESLVPKGGVFEALGGNLWSAPDLSIYVRNLQWWKAWGKGSVSTPAISPGFSKQNANRGEPFVE
ncbi:Hypothetical predicted protein [Olea europaea subsp. europaea]|uniref:Uncharacterized protein n=1 Tax=Olea europaea subsp. europaea TaxID=158383 RepID=A0A8S0S397_OLEEU|nr:Hypothetical predicted protein [Olea europaea subsp. europaea]